MFDELYKNINYRFKNEKLIEEALTHPSVSNKNKNKNIFNYQRLEFLGDSVLSLVISEYLVENHNLETEGDLSKRRSFLVCSETISKIAIDKVKLENFIIISKGEKNTGGANRQTNLENCMEAILGAIFLDSNFDVAKKIILKLWDNIDNSFIHSPMPAKTELQEWAQENLRILPNYEIIKEEIDKKNNLTNFLIKLNISNFESVQVWATSKKEAEKKCAELMLKKIKG